MDDYYDLGTYTHPMTTSSPEAQVWFNRGMSWRYGFNHEEAVRCFRGAVEHDPECAMAYWGIAHGSGPYYNKPWEDFVDEELEETIATTRRATEHAIAR